MPRAITCGPQQVPSGDTVQAVSKLDILTEDGRAVSFGSLFEDRKTLAVFIRMRHPSAGFPPSYVCSPQDIFGVQSALFSALYCLTGLTGN